MRILEDSQVFFLHIPKTAGSSLRELLASRFAPSEILAFHRSDSREMRLNQLTRLEDVRFFHGHLPYSFVDRFRKRPFLITLLRDPVQRAISAYRYMQWQVLSGQTAHMSSVRKRDYVLASQLSIKDFIRQEPDAASRHLGNLQSWFLSALNLEERLHYAADYRVAISSSDLERAMDNLAACDFIGLTERMKESVDLLAYSLVTRPFPEISTANWTSKRIPPVEVDKDTHEELEKFTSADHQLYTVACSLFCKRHEWMMEQLLREHAEHCSCHQALTPSLLPTVFNFDGPVPGDGWYAPEREGDRWFSWTGPTCHSTIELATPVGSEFMLIFCVLHAMRWEQLPALDVRLNGVRVRLAPQCSDKGTTLSGSIVPALLRPTGSVNVISFRVPNVFRPCEDDTENEDSRLLGIALAHVELKTLVRGEQGMVSETAGLRGL